MGHASWQPAHRAQRHFAPGDRAALELQFDRLLEETANHNRRCFQDAGDLERWLGAVLSKPECISLGRFLAGATTA